MQSVTNMIDDAQPLEGAGISSGSNSNVCACYKCLECYIWGRRTTANGVGILQLAARRNKAILINSSETGTLVWNYIVAIGYLRMACLA
jgi:hypothetical protein